MLNHAPITSGLAWFIPKYPKYMLYIIIISGQAFPLDLFPDYSESSSFNDGVTATYTPSIYEFMLGFGGVGISAAIYLFAIMVLDFTPRSLDNKATTIKE